MIKTIRLRLGISMGLFIFQGLINNAWAGVSGTVYRDLPMQGSTINTYGIKDANESGVEGITVTAYPENLSTTTAADGSWSLATTAAKVRVEFSSIPAYLASSPVNTGSNTTVQFLNDGETANLGVHYPNDFSDSATPLVAVPRHENGQATGNTDPALFSLRYGENGNFGADDGVPDGWTGNADASFEEIGATWGLAYQTSQKRLFLSALVKRHSGMANGLDAIYVLDYNTVPVANKSHFNLQGVAGIDLGSLDRSSDADHTLSATNTAPSVDIDAFDKAATIGFGDIELSEDEKTLWAVNLHQKALIQMDVSGSNVPNNVSQTLLSSLTGLPSCNGGELRPWGLKFYQGKGYLGFVCDAATSGDPNDLMAYVHSFAANNLAAGLTQELSFTLNYTRSTDATHDPRTNFEPWMFVYDHNLVVDGSYAQAVLSDIEFSPDGSMYLGFLDRWGIQMSHRNHPPIAGVSWTSIARVHGELLKACRINSAWVLEGGDPACPTQNETSQASGVNNNGEFFNDHGGDDSREYTLGALAQLAGSNELISAMNDPFPGLPADLQYWHNNGLQWFSLTDGSHQNYIQTDPTSGACDYEAGVSRACGFGKSSGVGDVELLTAPAPIEIGNRVWLDNDNDGVQDADEAGIAGVTVELRSGTGTLATATTDNNGHYLFSNDPNGTSTASHRYNITGLTADTAYTVRIPNVTGGSKQAALGANDLTTSNSGEGTQTDSNDSDGIVLGDHAEASILAADIPYAGANNHRFDFGFRSIATGCVTVSNTVTATLSETDSNTSNNSATADLQINCSNTPTADISVIKTASESNVASGDRFTYTVTVNNAGPDTATGVVVTDQLPAGVTYSTHNASQGSYNTGTGAWTVGDVTMGQTATLTIEVSVD
jgi:uncharacterized repeat protein (TIGR01451 family)